MLKLYDVSTALNTILQRSPLQSLTHLPGVLGNIEEIFGQGVTPTQAVTKILESVRKEGDVALLQWSERLDHVQLNSLRVSTEKLSEAYKALPSKLREAMSNAANRIRAYHHRQPMPSWETDELGGRLGQRLTAIDKVGIYVPGGTAPLPSSLLMSAIPAQVAGVRSLIVCTPPTPNTNILAAAYLCGIDQVYQIGGAQAIAAMAFGTQSVPKVDKIVGPGNLFVTLAKQQVYGLVGLDGLTGPTETLIIADGTANPTLVAADLLAQAEHDILASAILLTPDRALAKAVQLEVVRQMESLSRADTIAQSLNCRGGVVITPDLNTAADLANQYAPEHLCLFVANPNALVKRINNAGGLFLGEYSCEVLGDYIAGPSHVMPTGGTARFASPLNVLDFVKITSMIALDAESTLHLSPLAAEMARAESLTAHVMAATLREASDVL